MDFNKVIREKREELNQLVDLKALDRVLGHLDAAEKHFQNARGDGGSEFFTDVIYRAKQVFEGILKEAYKVIAEKDASDITPAQIEENFSEQRYFGPA